MLVASVSDYGAPAGPQRADETLDVLSNWNTLMIDAVEGHGGRVQQMTGDGVGAIFDAPGHFADAAAAAWAGMQAAREMADLARQFNVERTAAGQAPVATGIGLATGDVVAGLAGPPRRPAFVCVGATLHRAARLADLAAMGDQPVLIDGATRNALADRVATAALPPTRLPGGAKPVPVYALAVA